LDKGLWVGMCDQVYIVYWRAWQHAITSHFAGKVVNSHCYSQIQLKRYDCQHKFYV